MLFANGIIFLGFAVAAFCLYHYMKETGRNMTWWKWVLAVLWVIALYLSVAIIGTFVGEGAPQAVVPGILFFGVIMLITGIILWRLLFSASFLPKKK